MYVCVYVCVYVCMHACMYACMIVCMYVCMHVCVYASMHACMHACCMRVYKTINKERPFGHSTYRASAHSRLCHMRWHDMITSRHTMSYDYIKAHHVIWLHQGTPCHMITSRHRVIWDCIKAMSSRLCHQGYVHHVIKAMYTMSYEMTSYDYIKAMSSRLCTSCHQGYVHHVIWDYNKATSYGITSKCVYRYTDAAKISVCIDIQIYR